MNLTRVLLLCALATASTSLVACSRDREQSKRAYLESGNKYAEQRQYNEAIVEYRNALQIDPAFGEAHLRLSEALIQTGDAAAAARELVRAADLTPADVELQLKAGNILLLVGAFDDAGHRADKVLASDSRNVNAQILKANALAGLRDLERALAEIQQAVQLDPTRSLSFMTLGTVQAARGQKVEAEEAFRRAVELDPQSVNAHLSLANYYWTTGRKEDAEAGFKAALALAPSNALANRALATFYLASSRAAEAEPYLKAVALDSRDPVPSIALADYYVLLRRYDDAVNSLQPLSAHSTRGTESKLRIAAIKYMQGQTQEGHALIDELLKGTPSRADVLITKARFHVTERKFSEALSYAKRAVEIDPGLVAGHYVVATIHYELGNSAEAKRSFAKVLELNPRAVAAQVQLANIELGHGNASASLQHAQKAVALQPQHATARLLVAKSQLAQNNLVGAERELLALKQSHAQWAPVHASLGVLYMRQGNAAAARQALGVAQQLDPQNLEAFASSIALDVRAGETASARARLEERVGGSTAASSPVVLMASRSFMLLQDYTRAEELLKNLIQRDPDNLQAYADLAQMYARQQRLDESRSYFEEVVRRQPRSVPANTMVGLLLHVQKRTPEAMRRYEQVLAIDPNAPVAANNLAWLYAENGQNLETAVELAKRAKSALPESAEVSDTLGFVYLKKQAPDLAIPVLRDAVRQDPQNPRYRLRLGIAFAKNGRPEEARREILPVLASHGSLPEAAEARAALELRAQQ